MNNKINTDSNKKKFTKVSEKGLKQGENANKKVLSDTQKMDNLSDEKQGNVFTNFIAEYGIIGTTIGTACGFLINTMISTLSEEVISPFLDKRIFFIFELLGMGDLKKNTIRIIISQSIIFIFVIVILMLFILFYKNILKGNKNEKNKREEMQTLREKLNTNNMRTISEELKIISQNLDFLKNYLIIKN